MTGLLTFTGADNYGALLQAYALQTTLKKLGHDSVFLNHIKPSAPEEKNLSGLPPFLRKKIEETLEHHRLRSDKFEAFRKEKLVLSGFIPAEEYAALDEKYDRFIVGSDQVWNYGASGGDLFYALPFAGKGKRFSYAASFGGQEGIDKATDRFWEELGSFEKISVREDTGAELIREKTGLTPSVNIDPCLLLTKEEWEENLTGSCPAEEKYVLLFMIEYDGAFYTEARDFAAEKGLSLRIVTASYMPQFGFEAFSGTGPVRWLQNIRNAEYVFCDSFHAAVFSIIFERNFEVNLSKAKLAGRTSRVTQLLEKFGLGCDGMNENADYISVKKKIGTEAEKSLAYLKSIYE